MISRRLPHLPHSLLALAFLLLSACNGIDEPIERDFAQIQEQDTLTALAAYNSTGYFLYRGEPLGYEYELLKAFAEDHDLHLRVVVVQSRDSLSQRLRAGDGDIAAARLIPTLHQQKERIAFTDALYKTQPVLVQQGRAPDQVDLPGRLDTVVADRDVADAVPGGAPEHPAAPAPQEGGGGQAEALPDTFSLRARLVTRPAQLAGETVHMPAGSEYFDRLVELSDSLSGDVEVVEVEEGDATYETIIQRVSRGEVDFTVSPGNLAKLKENYFTNIVVRPVMGDPHPVAWAVRENAPELLQALNAWLEEQKQGDLLDALYRKYFVDRRGYRERLQSEYLTSETGRLSDYDPILKRHAPEIGWDWRLLASQTFQESRFSPTARSWAGATGLLQLMPATAREFNVGDPLDPEQNVAGAVRFLAWLQDYWRDKIPDEAERMKFILASYNTGHGHVEDARRLTEKHGGDPTTWNDVAYWLLQKSKRQYYEDPVVKYGFCRGLEPVTYVALILDRFDHYRQFVTGDQAEA